jgi:hypothetical protein
MVKGFTNSANRTSREITLAKKKQKEYFQKSQAGWHEDYMKSGAQYQMTFLEYKKLRRNKKKYTKWLETNNK